MLLADYHRLLENPATEVSNRCSWARLMPDCRRDPSAATFSLLTRGGGRKKCGKRLLVFGSARGLLALSPLRREENHPAWSNERERMESGKGGRYFSSPIYSDFFGRSSHKMNTIQPRHSNSTSLNPMGWRFYFVA